MIEKKVAIVTGASRGIGKAIAIDFAKRDYVVVINYVCNKVAAEEVVEIVESLGKEAIIFKADISKVADVKKMMHYVGEKYGRIDVLVNNASLEYINYIWEHNDDDWDAGIKTTLNGSYYTSKYVLPYMLPLQNGKIINISSIHDVVPRKAATCYCSAKAGLLMFTKTLALELAPHNIQVNAVSPGLTLTDRTSGILKDDGSVDEENDVVSLNPMKRAGTPEEVAAAVMYFAGDNSNYTTGTTIYIDGGYMNNLCPERDSFPTVDILTGLIKEMEA